MKLQDILNKHEELALKKLIDNSVAISALKKVFLQNLYYSGTLKENENPDPRRNFICQLLYNEDMSMDYNLNDERIGQKTRAAVEGIRLVEQSFREIETLRDKPEAGEEETNQAR